MNHHGEVIIHQTRIPKYREPFFNKLFDLGDRDGIKYQVFVSKDRHQQFKAESAMTKNIVECQTLKIKVHGREFHFRKIHRENFEVDLVICEYGLKNFLIYTLLFLMRPKFFAFWGHGDTRTKKISNIEKALKRLLLRKSDFFLAYTEACATSVNKNGIPKSRIRVINNSIDTLEITNGIEKFDHVDEFRFRQEFKLNESDIVFAFIGSFEKEKRLDFLFDAFEQISKKVPEAKLLVYSPESFDQVFLGKRPPNVFVHGEADNRIKIGLSKTCFALLNPGRVGLIAVDSFAMGVPIITTDWRFHAPEYSYLNLTNSISASDSVDEYASAVIDLLGSKNTRDRLREGCLESARFFSIEKMAQNYHSAVINCIELLHDKKG